MYALRYTRYAKKLDRLEAECGMIATLTRTLDLPLARYDVRRLDELV